MAVPMWRQIADDLREKIESGLLGADGRPLPTELELQDEHGASRNTVRDAIKWLTTRGLVYTRSGQGTFVLPKIDPFVTTFSADPLSAKAESNAFEVAVRDSRREPLVSQPRVETKLAADLPEIPARELELPAEASVVSRHQERRINGVPYSLQTTFYPMSLVEAGAARLIIAKDIAEGAVSYIEEMLGIKQAGWRDRITVRIPDTTETAFFSLPDDGRVAVLQFIRTGFDESGRPFRVTITTYPADRNEIVLESGTVPALVDDDRVAKTASTERKA
jgi:GntR family transcriptional regulator